jgi:hypothetical protein
MAEETTVTRELRHDGATETIARLAAQRTKFRGAVAKLTGQRAEDATRIAKLEADLAEARKAEGAVKELADLKAKVKLDGHRGKFNELARAAGAREKALEDLWEKSGYKADGDLPDETAIKAAIAKQQTDRDYLFEPPGENGQGGSEGGPDESGEPEAEQPRPGPARGQGGTRKSSGSATQITDAQMRDPLWCGANQGKIAAAAKAAADLPINQVGTKFTIV